MKSCASMMALVFPSVTVDFTARFEALKYKNMTLSEGAGGVGDMAPIHYEILQIN